MLDGEPSFTKSAQKRLNKDVLYSQVLEEVHSTPQEATQEGQGRGQTERGNTCSTFLNQGPLMEHFGASRLGQDWLT